MAEENGSRAAAARDVELSGPDDRGFKLHVGVTRGDVDCFLNLFAQIIGTMVGVIAALGPLLMAPYQDKVSGEEYKSMNNLVQHIIYGKITAGMCVTMIFGNIYYAYMAVRMMRNEKRNDVTCLPYGVNTPAAYAFVFNVVGPAVRAAADAGLSYEDGIWHAWRVGCVANLVAGTIATVAGFFGPLLVRIAPKAALLIALAGIGFTWLGVAQVILCFKAGYAGLLPFGAALVFFFSGVDSSPCPSAIVVMVVGAAVGWASCQGWPDGADIKTGGTLDALNKSAQHLGFYYPTFLDGASFAAIPEVLAENIAIILPVSLTGAVNTLLSAYASHEAGDVYNIRECMVVDGLTTVVAALFGSPLGTCVYIGHPQFKANGGKVTYSFFNCIGFCVLAASGLFAAVTAFLPPYAIAPVILFVGLAINKDTFAVTPEHQIPAAILGLFPPVAEWILAEWPHGLDPPAELSAVGRGALLIGVIWTAIAVTMIERHFRSAAVWCLVAGLLSAVGLIHQKNVDLSFKTFASSPFGVSPCSFLIGYSSMALGSLGLALLQHAHCDRVPFPEKEENCKDEEVAQAMGRMVSDASRFGQQSMLMGHTNTRGSYGGAEDDDASSSDSDD